MDDHPWIIIAWPSLSMDPSSLQKNKIDTAREAKQKRMESTTALGTDIALPELSACNQMANERRHCTFDKPFRGSTPRLNVIDGYKIDTLTYVHAR